MSSAEDNKKAEKSAWLDSTVTQELRKQAQLRRASGLAALVGCASASTDLTVRTLGIQIMEADRLLKLFSDGEYEA